MPTMNMVQAINDGLRLEMRRDPRVVILGEDVGKVGGVFRVIPEKILSAKELGLPSQIAAVRALENPGYYQQKYRETARLRMDLTARLAELGLEVVPGTANFLLCHIAAAGPDAGTLIRGCQSAGLFLRDVRGMGSGFSTHTFRIAVKDAATNQQAVKILRRQLGSSAARGAEGQAGIERSGGRPATHIFVPPCGNFRRMQ